MVVSVVWFQTLEKGWMLRVSGENHHAKQQGIWLFDNSSPTLISLKLTACT